MRFREHALRTLKLAFPVAVGQLGHVMLGVIDSMMIGKVGASHLAAASLVNGLFFLIMVFGIGLSTAVTPLVAIAKGASNDDECGIILRQSLLVNLAVSVLLVIATYILADMIKYMNQPPEVTALATSYLKILSFSIFPFMIFQTYRQFVEGLSLTTPPMYIALAANIINVIGNYILIYGKLGMPRLELDGAGYATFFTRCFIAVSLVIYVFSNKSLKRYDPTLRFRNINFPMIKKILNLGVPSGFQYFFEVSSFSFSAIMIGWIGKNQLAAHQIAINLASVTYMMILGIGVAGSIRVGTFLGADDRKNTRKAGFSAVSVAVMFMAVFGLTFILLRNYLPLLYTDNNEVIGYAVNLLIVAAFFQLSDGIQAVGQNILRGLTDVKVPMILSFISYWIVGVSISYYLGFILNLGVTGIWLGLLAGLTTTAIFFSIRFHLKTKLHS